MDKPIKRKAPSKCWKKGQSGNPKGGPDKDQSITFLMRKYLQNIPEGQKKTAKQAFVEKAYAKAVKQGDITAIKLIWNYMDGVPKGETQAPTVNITVNLEKQAEIQKALEDL